MIVFINFLILYLFLVFNLSFYIMYERKILSLFHFRFGPNKVFFFGFLQFLRDGLSLIFKDLIEIYVINFYFYFFIPLIILFLSMFF